MVFEAVEHAGAGWCETECAVRRPGKLMGKSMSDWSVANGVLSRLGPLCETADVGALLHVPLPCPIAVVPWLGSRLTLWPVPLQTLSVASSQILQVVCAVFSDPEFRRWACNTTYPEGHHENCNSATVFWVLQRKRRQILQHGESAKKIWSAGRLVMASGGSVQLRTRRARQRTARAASSARQGCVTGCKLMWSTWSGK